MSEDITQKTISNILKIIVLTVGIACTALVYVVEKLGGIFPLSVAITSVTTGPTLGMFTLGVLFPRANSKVRKSRLGTCTDNII